MQVLIVRTRLVQFCSVWIIVYGFLSGSGVQVDVGFLLPKVFANLDWLAEGKWFDECSDSILSFLVLKGDRII